MAIAFGDPRKTPARKGEITAQEREQLQRSDAAAKAFPGRNARALLDFSRPDTGPARTNPGGTDLSDITAIRRSESEVKRAEREDRMSRLPVRVQRLATDQGVTDLALLEIVGAVHRKSEIMGGERVQVFTSDLAKAIGISAKRADELLNEATRRGFIVAGSRTMAGGYFRSNL